MTAPDYAARMAVVREQAAKVQASQSWRKTSPVSQPVRQLGPSAYMGLKAR